MSHADFFTRTRSRRLSRASQPAPTTERMSNGSGSALGIRRDGGGYLLSLGVHVAVFFLLTMFAVSTDEETLLQALTAAIQEPADEAAEFQVPSEVLSQSVPEAAPEVGSDVVVDHSVVEPDVGIERLDDFMRTAPAGEQTGQDGANAEVVGEIQQRVAEAGGRQGEVQFALSWGSISDLDLHVVTPAGQRVHYDLRNSRCGAELDVDMNVTAPFSNEPVENIRWLRGRGVPGRLTVIVHLYTWRNRRMEDFQLLSVVDGKSELVEETVAAGNNLKVFRYVHTKESWSDVRRQKYREQMLRLQETEEKKAGDMLQQARRIEAENRRSMLLMNIIGRYPHTDASLQAMQLLEPTAGKLD